MEPKYTATKAHFAGVVTAGAALLVAYLSGNIETHMWESFGGALAVALSGWAGTYFAPPNKPKG